MNIHRVFWEKNPALLFGLSLLIGTSSYLFWPCPWNYLWPFLWGIYLFFLRRWPPLIFLFISIIYGFFIFADVEEQDSEIFAYFSPSTLKIHQSPFSKGLIYNGVLTIDTKKIPCSILYPFKSNHPKADTDYVLKGKIKKRGPYDYTFQTKSWTKVKKTWSFAEIRFQMKEKIRQFLDFKLKNPRVATFLSSLLTGDVEDRSLRYEFGKLGLQHILAISGFHFAILISFCSFFLSFFLNPKSKIIVLIIAINIYFIFIGAVPAVQRSYLTALFFLTSKLLKRSATGLNLLGASLFVEVLLDPFVAKTLGFQLSFASCLGILAFRPIFLPIIQAIFPKRDPSRLSILGKHGQLFASFLKEAITITLSVNAAIFPLIFFHFHSFPLLSLIYNLFFPFLVGISLFLLLMALLFDLLFPLLGNLFFILTDFLTSQLLELSTYPPLFLDISISFKGFAAWLIPFHLFGLFCISLLTNTSRFSYDFEGVTEFSSNGDRSSVG